MQWLLEHGADPNWPVWGGRPLHYALRHGTPIHYCEWLLVHGADPLLPDQDGTVPVAEAARKGRADVLELYEKRGVVITLEGDDAFLAACARANEAEARKLAAADPSVVERMQVQNPGMLADFAGAGNTAAVRLMLDLGFDAGMARIKPNWVAGETALHVAAAHGRMRAHPDATALHNVVCSGSLAAVQKLVEAEASVDAKDGSYKATPLQWAEYFVRESGAGNLKYLQREGIEHKQYTEIASYLRSREGSSP